MRAWPTCFMAICVFLFFIESYCAVKTLRIGGTLSLTGGTARVPLGLKVLDGVKFFEQWFAEQSDIVVDGEAYRITIEIFDDKSSKDTMRSLYESMLASGNFDYYLGPINTDFGLIAKDVVDGNGLLMQTTASDDDVSIGTVSSYTIKTPASGTFAAALLQARLAGARTFSYIFEDHPYQEGACEGATESAKEFGFLPPVCNFSVPNSLLSISNDTLAVYSQTIERLAQNCVQDVVILCAYDDPTVLVMLQRAKEISFSPALFMSTRIRLGTMRNSVRDYVVGSIIWSPNLNYPDDGLFGTPQTYAQNFRAQFGYTPDSFAAVGTAAPLYLWNAIRSADSTSWQDVSYSLGRSDFQTFWGRIYYAANHAVLVQPVTLQLLPNVGGATIAPPGLQTQELIYPMPAWDERVETTDWMVYSGDVIMTVLAAIASLLSLASVLLVLHYRDTQVVRAAQPAFLIIALVGSVLMYSSIYTWLYFVTDASCKALPWLLSTGFSLIFSCLASKTWRVYRLFYNSKLRAVSLSQWPLFTFLFVSCAILWGLLVIWSAVDPPVARLVVPDVNRPVLNYYTCHTGTAGKILLIVILASEGVLLVASAIMAFRVRSVQLLLFKESKFIGFAIYILTILGGICIGFAASSLSPKSWFWVRTCCILAAAFITIVCVMVPKLVYHARLTSAAATHQHSIGSVDSVIGRTENEDVDQQLLLFEVQQLEKENARLRASLNRRSQELARLGINE